MSDQPDQDQQTAQQIVRDYSPCSDWGCRAEPADTPCVHCVLLVEVIAAALRAVREEGRTRPSG